MTTPANPPIFKRNDQQVQDDAKSLDLEAFKRKYSSQAKEQVLNATWKDARKKMQQGDKTDEATNLPEVTKEVKTQLSDKSVVTNTTLANGTQIASVDSEANGGTITSLEETPADDKKAKKKPSGKKDKKDEKPAAEVAVVSGDKPTRAARLRVLITEGKDKAAAKAILVSEGYDVTTIHSEWNRLTK